MLIALQDWGTRHVMGSGTLTATADSASAEARRARALVGRHLPAVTLTAHDGTPADLGARLSWTVLYCFPGAFAPGSHGYPPGWSDIPAPSAAPSSR